MLDDVIRSGAEATLTWLGTKDPGLKHLIDKSYGCAVFPAVGRASAVLGCGRGQGAVFEHGKPIGFATVTQLTIGVQVGGQTYSELLIFSNKDALEAFKKGKKTFTANASAVIVKAGGSGTSDFSGVIAKAYTRGGMLLEVSLGGQSFKYFKHLDKSKKKKADKGNGAPRLGGQPGETQHEEEGGLEAKQSEGAPTQGAENGEDQIHAAEGEATETSEHETSEHAAEEGHDDPVEGAGDPPGDPPDDPPDDPPETAHAKGNGHGASVGQRVSGRLKGTGRKFVGNIAHFLSEHGAPHGLHRIESSIAAKRHPTLLGKPLAVLHKVREAAVGLDMETKLGPTLSGEVDAALRRMIQHDPGIEDLLNEAYGYAVFPLVGKASAVLGVGYGRGEVFEQRKLIGYGAVVQVMLGVQVGGQTYDELIVFQNKGALERYKSENLAFAMNASAVIVRAGAAATTNYSAGTAVFIHPEGGMAIELSLGGQKFIYRKKALGAPLPNFVKGQASRAEGEHAEPQRYDATAAEPHEGEGETAEAQNAQPQQEEQEAAEAQSTEPEEGQEETAEAQGAEPEEGQEEGQEETAEAQGAEPEEGQEETAEAQGAEPEEEESAEALNAEPEEVEAAPPPPPKPPPRSPMPRSGVARPERAHKEGPPKARPPNKSGRA